MSKPHRAPESEWSTRNAFKRVGLYLICLVLIASGVLILTQSGSNGFLGVVIIALCGYFIYTDIRILTAKPKHISEDEADDFVHLEDGVIICADKDAATIRIELDQVKAIGEFTEEGGLAGRWNLILFGSEKHAVISMYKAGANELIGDLSKHLGAELSLRLSQTFGNTSRIVWPEQLDGKPVWVKKGRWSISPEYVLSEEVEQLLKQNE
jgi:hypothetical protein